MKTPEAGNQIGNAATVINFLSEYIHGISFGRREDAVELSLKNARESFERLNPSSQIEDLTKEVERLKEQAKVAGESLMIGSKVYSKEVTKLEQENDIYREALDKLIAFVETVDDDGEGKGDWIALNEAKAALHPLLMRPKNT
jgi:hypothetical protein